MLIDVQSVALALGGAQIIGAQIRSMAELEQAIKRGLPKRTLDHVARSVFSERADQRILVHRIVPEATWKRRRDRLSPAESEKTERIARVTAYAKAVWGNAEDAREFVTTPHPLLDGRPPIEAAVTDLGARQVEEILAGIEHGLPV